MRRHGDNQHCNYTETQSVMNMEIKHISDIGSWGGRNGTVMATDVCVRWVCVWQVCGSVRVCVWQTVYTGSNLSLGHLMATWSCFSGHSTPPPPPLNATEGGKGREELSFFPSLDQDIQYLTKVVVIQLYLTPFLCKCCFCVSTARVF